MSRSAALDRDVRRITEPRYIDFLRERMKKASEKRKAACGARERRQAPPGATEAGPEARESPQSADEEKSPDRSTWFQQLHLRASADPADDDPVVFFDAACGGSTLGRVCIRLHDLLHWWAVDSVRVRCEDGEALLGRTISLTRVEGGLELLVGDRGSGGEAEAAGSAPPAESGTLDGAEFGVFVFAKVDEGAGDGLRLRFVGGERAPEERQPWTLIGDLLCGADALDALASGSDDPATIICCGQSRGRGMRCGRPSTRRMAPPARQEAEAAVPGGHVGEGSGEGASEGTQRGQASTSGGDGVAAARAGDARGVDVSRTSEEEEVAGWRHREEEGEEEEEEGGMQEEDGEGGVEDGEGGAEGASRWGAGDGGFSGNSFTAGFGSLGGQFGTPFGGSEGAAGGTAWGSGGGFSGGGFGQNSDTAQSSGVSGSCSFGGGGFGTAAFGGGGFGTAAFGGGGASTGDAPLSSAGGHEEGGGSGSDSKQDPP